MKLEWLVPVIVVIVYVIGWIVKAKEEIDAKAKKPVGKAPGQELDRFLEEIERLRRQNESGPAPVSNRDVDNLDGIEVKKPPVVVRPAPPPPVVQRARPVAVPIPATTQSRPRDFPQAQQRPTATSPRSALPAGSRTRRSNEMTGLMAMLQNPRNIANAIVLNEVFGPPKSKRG